MEITKIRLNEIKIDERFLNLLPSQTEEETKELSSNIARYGLIDPLIVWYREKEKEKYILVDGHHRYKLLYTKGQGMEVNVYLKKFLHAEEVEKFILQHQTGRRNSNKSTQKYTIGQLYNLMVKQTDRTKNFQSDTKGSTSSKMAASFNVSESTIKNYAKYAKDLENLEAKKSNLKNMFLQIDESRSEIIEYFLNMSQDNLETISKINILYFIKEAEEKTKNEIAAEYKPKPKITENKIFQKTSQKPNATKSQNLTFAEQQPKQKNNTAKEQQTEPKKQIVNSNLTNVKTYTELEIQDLKLQVEYYKELAELKNFEFQQIKKQIDDNEKIIEHLRQEKTTGLKTWDRIKINDTDLIIIKREQESIFKFSKILNWELISTEESQAKAKKRIEQMLNDKKTICEKY